MTHLNLILPHHGRSSDHFSKYTPRNFISFFCFSSPTAMFAPLVTVYLMRTQWLSCITAALSFICLYANSPIWIPEAFWFIRHGLVNTVRWRAYSTLIVCSITRDNGQRIRGSSHRFLLTSFLRLSFHNLLFVPRYQLQRNYTTAQICSEFSSSMENTHFHLTLTVSKKVEACFTKRSRHKRTVFTYDSVCAYA